MKSLKPSPVLSNISLGLFEGVLVAVLLFFAKTSVTGLHDWFIAVDAAVIFLIVVISNNVHKLVICDSPVPSRNRFLESLFGIAACMGSTIVILTFFDRHI
ncbi:MAG TPA: hypothetical protein VHE10_01870 [Candidatus Paceibacterota bacterium]|nr:hypothetical protein [Candidatus Paceibacterota bacterium]